MPKTGYVNGSDMLLIVGTKAIGHCTSHTLTYSTETKDHAVKPPQSQASSDGKFKEKSVSGLSYSIKADSLYFYDETEMGFDDLTALWIKGEPVTVKCVERGSAANAVPYLEGSCIIDSLEMNAPANDDVSCSISLSNNGAPTKFNKAAYPGTSSGS